MQQDMVLTDAQQDALRGLCQRYGVPYRPEHYYPAFDLAEGWVNGWIGGPEFGRDVVHKTIFVGCSPEGEVHS